MNNELSPNKAPHWTTDYPTVSGFYWYRERDMPAEVFLWDHDLQWLRQTGNDIPWGEGMAYEVNGQFWSEPLTPPDA
jgi:hypothetical protein